MGGGQTNFKIPLGTRVFRKSCSTSNLARVGVLFDKFLGFMGFFVQNREYPRYRACQAKPSLADSSQAGSSETYQVKHRVLLHSKAKQTSQAQQSKQAKHSKSNKSKTSNQTNQTKPKQK